MVLRPSLASMLPRFSMIDVVPAPELTPVNTNAREEVARLSKQEDGIHDMPRIGMPGQS